LRSIALMFGKVAKIYICNFRWRNIMATFVSLNEMRDAFQQERIEIFTETPHFARIVVEIGPPPDRIVNQIMVIRFGQPGTEVDPDYFGVVTLDEDDEFFDIISVLGIDPEKPEWEVEGTKLNRQISAKEALTIKQRESFYIQCDLPLKVEIVGYRLPEEDGSLSNEVGICVHIAPIDAEYVAPIDEDDLSNPIYDWSAELGKNPDMGPLTYDDIAAAFNLDADAKIWLTREAPSAEEIAEMIAMSYAELESGD